MPPTSRRLRVATVLTVTAGLTVSGLLAARPQGASAAAAASTADVIYVNRASTANCSDAGSGTKAQPFCTIGAASQAAQPGQTVIIEPGTYPAATISASGTPAQPITFLGANDGISVVSPIGGTSAATVVVSGAHNVIIRGFQVVPPSQSTSSPAITVTGSSSGVTMSSSHVLGRATAPAIEVGGTASDVTISRDSVNGGVGVQVDAGASGTMIAGNTLIDGAGGHPVVVVTGAPGTVVTGNTLVGGCGQGIEVSGASPQATIENNIVEPSRRPDSTATCTTPITAITVSAESTAQTVTDYNVIDPVTGGPLYDWGGTAYSSLTDFQAATTQGTHDIAADPKLSQQVDGGFPLLGEAFWFPPAPDSPAIDSADASAPGALSRDQLDNPRADDPGVANAGTGYFDRGAVELEAALTHHNGTVVNNGPLTVTAHQEVTSPWPTNGPIGIYRYDFGDGSGTIVTTSTSSVQHAYRSAGVHKVEFAEFVPQAIGVTPPGAPHTNAANVVVGAAYTPVAPTRILDTRTGAGVARAGAVPSRGTLTLAIPSAGGVAAADMSAVVMNVTVTRPTANGWLAASPAGSIASAPTVSNLNFTAGQTVANLVTVQVAGGKVTFYNGSGGTVQVVADLAGVYGPGGSGFQPQPPARVLDTRTGNGAAKDPLPARQRLRLNLTGRVPADATAVVLNVTVTQPAKSGWLAAYPDSSAAPTTSSLNFTAGQTVANQVITPLNGGIVDLYNGSPGTTQVIADLGGYFAAGAPDVFVPYGPARTMDTRTMSSPVLKNTARSYPAASYQNNCSPACPAPAAVVDNVTVTQPQRDGYLTVYPSGHPRPATSSLNFRAGQTVPNLVTTQAGNGNVTFYNSSGGSIEFIVDEFGYYIAAS